MRKLIVILITVLSVGAAFPQSTAKSKPKTAAKSAKPAEKPATPTATASLPQLPDEATVMAFYHRMFGFQENLSFKVAEIKWSPVPGIAQVTSVVSTPQGQQVSTIYITPDGKHAISGDLIPFGKDPFAGNRDILKEAFGPVRGSPTPDVTLVEFADLECPACKAAEPTIDKLLADVPNARLIFQSFPLEQLHPWAKQAAEYLDCLYRTSNESALSFMEAVFTNQPEITPQNATEKLNSYVTMAKGDPAKVAACAAMPQTAARLEKSIDLGKKLEITGTPTLFVNGRPISNLSNIPYETLKTLVQFEAAQK